MKEGLFARTGLAIILLTAACSTAFGYNQQNDKPIWQVAFTVAGNISADMQSVYFNVSPVGGSNYYFSNYEILGIDEEDSAKARVKLRFVGNDKHYFRITKSTGNGIYYWTESGKSYHVSPNCRTLKRSKKIYSGSTIPSDKRDPCNVCVR